MEEPEKSQSDEKDRPLSDESHRSLSHQTSTLLDETTDAATSATAENDQPQPQLPEPTFHPRTYVVQILKDQIYRVPPPENAHMLEERTRNPPKKKSVEVKNRAKRCRLRLMKVIAVADFVRGDCSFLFSLYSYRW
ncbi:UNVERIFIED_CONTAM: hypothetical protein Scaly_1100200 [Sesamum calycinum]|uniref:Uncharacterized protein n=1 Tax=Sesamum calycinum TaxID=2727403 RepID=A0AAW2QNA1_9LAMI